MAGKGDATTAKDAIVGDEVPEQSPSFQALAKYLRKHLKVTLSDGRVIVGFFLCTDSDMNLILGDSSEFEVSSTSEDGKLEKRRHVGSVMVPGSHIVKVEAMPQ